MLICSRLYDDGKYSDLTVKSSEKTYRVHKAIVCPRSKFFAAACDGHFEASHTSIRSPRGIWASS